MADNNQNGYKPLEDKYTHLVQRPDVLGRRSPHIIGQNVDVRLIARECAREYKGDIYAMAKDRGIDPETVRQAIDWCESYNEIVATDDAIDEKVVEWIKKRR